MTSFFYDKIGEYFGQDEEKCPCKDAIQDFEPGLLADFGVAWITFFHELLIPDEVREARKRCRSPCCGKPPLCPPIKQKPQRSSCSQNQFPRPSCSH